MILIVDDDTAISAYLEAVLKKSGYPGTIEKIESGEKALEWLGIGTKEKPRPISLILMDVNLSGISGIQTCARITESRQYPDVPILVLIAGAREETLPPAYRAGAADYISKPIFKPELLGKVRFALKVEKEIRRRKRQARELKETLELLEVANQVLLRSSGQDQLTGLANRRQFDISLDNEWKRSQREKTRLSLLMLDIDYFKLYNDHYGHQGGDGCLVSVANVIKKSVRRPADVAARYGGEEFAIILPNTDGAGCGFVANKIITTLRELALPHAASRLERKNVSLSIGGVTGFTSDFADKDSFIKAADKLLYKAKESGRDRVEFQDLSVGAFHVE